jgi:hypothetical protein
MCLQYILVAFIHSIILPFLLLPFLEHFQRFHSSIFMHGYKIHPPYSPSFTLSLGPPPPTDTHPWKRPKNDNFWQQFCIHLSRSLSDCSWLVSWLLVWILCIRHGQLGAVSAKCNSDAGGTFCLVGRSGIQLLSGNWFPIDLHGCEVLKTLKINSYIGF